MVALKVSCPTARLIIPRCSAVEAVTLHCLDSSVWISSASLWDITDYNSVHWVYETLCYSCWLNDAALQSPAFWDSVARWWNYRAILKARLTCSICLMTKSFCLLLSPLRGVIQKVQWAGTEICLKVALRMSTGHKGNLFVHGPSLAWCLHTCSFPHFIGFFSGIVKWEIARKSL